LIGDEQNLSTTVLQITKHPRFQHKPNSSIRGVIVSGA